MTDGSFPWHDDDDDHDYDGDDNNDDDDDLYEWCDDDHVGRGEGVDRWQLSLAGAEFHPPARSSALALGLPLISSLLCSCSFASLPFSLS